MANRVYLVQQVAPTRTGWQPNITPASEFGALYPIFNSGENPYREPEVSYRRAVQRLEGISNGDCILWAGGDPMGLFLVARALDEYPDVTEIRFLRWVKEPPGYMAIPLALGSDGD